MSPVSNVNVNVNVNNQPEDPEKKKRRVSPVEEVPTPKQDEEQKWLLERTGLSTINDLTTLTKLNLPNCGLSTLPVNLSDLLPNLSILFAPKNHFEELPEVIGKCSNLQMVSFKENGMKRIHPDALQPQLRWLILTGNSITELPETIGRCKKLQKLMLSGNGIKSLPESIDQLSNLELVRLACNQLHEPPMKLLQLPSLHWVAFSNNPFLKEQTHDDHELGVIDDPILEDTKWPVLGQGAGGVTRQVTWGDMPVAVKTFVGEMTSDGSPQDERAISVVAASLKDPSLIKLLGQTTNGALIMELLQGFEGLAGPPSLETCSRDVYPTDRQLSEDFAWKIAMSLLQVLHKLHGKGICHGDFYSHNILISSSSEKVKLSDFGAAFFYQPSSKYGDYIQRIELRSYGVLVEELQTLVATKAQENRWGELTKACQDQSATFDGLLAQFQ